MALVALCLPMAVDSKLTANLADSSIYRQARLSCNIMERGEARMWNKLQTAIRLRQATASI